MPLISVIDDSPPESPIQSTLSAEPILIQDISETPDDELSNLCSELYAIPLPTDSNDVIKLEELYTKVRQSPQLVNASTAYPFTRTETRWDRE